MLPRSEPRGVPGARRVGFWRHGVKKAAGKCKACGERFKPSTGRQIYCKREECISKRRYEYWKKYIVHWRKKHPDYWKNYLRRWRKKNPDYFREWRKKNPDYFREWYRRRMAKRA